jgi:Mg-chelatase subunit ChlD
MSNTLDPNLVRWRLVLGHYAEERLPGGLAGRDQRIGAALDFLYSREYKGRGVRPDTTRHDATKQETDKKEGTLDPSQLEVPAWLSEVRELFPRETVEVIEKHALDRYGMMELISDRDVLERLEPNMDLLRMILQFRGHLKGEVLDSARRMVRHVVEELKQKLSAEIRRAFGGQVNRYSRSPRKVAQNFDWRTTIRKNLKYYDAERGAIVLQEPLFYSRLRRRLPWSVILCVDQSGSMARSVIHSAVMAGILSGLPLINVKLVVFDTAVVDLSEYVDDPVEALMNVQLGGGTDIGQAMTYCEGQIENPHRTVLVLVSDFCEGASQVALLNTCRRLSESGVKLIGLAALDDKAEASYDHSMAASLAEAGMDIAALTPARFANWLAAILK